MAGNRPRPCGFLEVNEHRNNAHPVPLHDGRPGIWGIGWLVGRSAAGRVSAPAGGAKAQVVLYPDGLAVVLLTT